MNASSLTATLEDYLEAIFNIISRRKVARSMEIAKSLDVKRPTVTVALRTLAEKGLINYEPRSFITLTDQGEKIAKCVDNRHHILRDVFTEVLNLPADESEKAACSMEHGMEPSICRALTSLLMAVRNDPVLAQTLSSAIEHENRTMNCASECNYDQKNGSTGASSEKALNLNALVPGESGTIIGITGNSALKKRLGEMGVTTGQTIKVVKAAPLDDPIEIKVRNYNMSLRREEAEDIRIERQ